VYVDPEWFGVVGEPSEMESGTLYFGADRRPTSRLSCQVVITPEMEGMRVTVAPYS
ncbi:MAG: 2Fe-2S ferredoxin, partial [Sphingobium sp. 32-64-5]